MKYDYLHKFSNRIVLSRDGKNPDIIIIKNSNESVFAELGKLNFLKGQALKDYKRKGVVEWISTRY